MKSPLHIFVRDKQLKFCIMREFRLVKIADLAQWEHVVSPRSCAFLCSQPSISPQY